MFRKGVEALGSSNKTVRDREKRERGRESGYSAMDSPVGYNSVA